MYPHGLLTHAHTDHVGALLNLLQSEADGEDTGITIDHIYYNFASLDWYKKHELGDLGTADAILTALAGLPKGGRLAGEKRMTRSWWMMCASPC